MIAEELTSLSGAASPFAVRRNEERSVFHCIEERCMYVGGGRIERSVSSFFREASLGSLGHFLEIFSGTFLH